jgi:alpha-beta hydrolase superfamily lysophospholipase
MKRRTLLVGALASAGLATAGQAFGRAVASVVDGPPRLEADAFISFDGTRLPMTVWRADKPKPKAVIVALHGMNDYAAAFGLAAPFWAEEAVATYAYDQRGFGRSATRGRWGGEEAMAEDLRTLCTLLRAKHPKTPLAIVGESMGGAVAVVAASSDRPPDADRLILSSPAVWGWGAQPPVNVAALWLAGHVAPGASVTAPSWVTRKIRATDNREELLRMSRDPNMIFRTRIGTIYGLTDLMQHARERIGQVRGPVLYLYGAHDDLIPKPAAFFAAGRLPPGARTAYYPQGYHLLTRDLQAQTVWTDILAYIAEPRAPLPSHAPPIPDRLTREQYTAANAAAAAG